MKQYLEVITIATVLLSQLELRIEHILKIFKDTENSICPEKEIVLHLVKLHNQLCKKFGKGFQLCFYFFAWSSGNLHQDIEIKDEETGMRAHCKNGIRYLQALSSR